MISKVATFLLVCLNSALFFGTVWVGRGYYALPKAARPEHALHELLSPGGGWGVALGLWGSALMAVMMLYTVRKAFMRVRGLGSLTGWLNFHIICGVSGPMFIVLHGGLYLPTGLIAVGFWCMVLVALSGVFGRYVYGLFPKRKGGQMMAWNATMVALAELRAELVASTADSRGDTVGEAVTLVEEFGFPAATLRDLRRLSADSRALRRKIKAMLAASDLSPQSQRIAADTLFAQLRLRQGIEASTVAHRMFRYWHLFHRPLAGTMYVIALYHITMALLFGGSLGALMELAG